LTFLLRACDPDVTEEAARSLDKLIDEFLILLFDSRRDVINMDYVQKLLFLKRIHLHLSKGGLGIAPLKAITGAAFIGSLTLNFNHMCILIPDRKKRWEAANSRLYTLFTRHLQSAKDICPQLRQISLDTMAAQQYHSIQTLISNAVQTHIEQEVDRSITAGRPAGCAEMFYANMNQWQQECGSVLAE